jgi:molybdopterin molybdotransferase
MTFVSALPFPEARAKVLEITRARRVLPGVERLPLLECAGRILAGALAADRDSPPLPRSVRDGFALRAAETPGRLTRQGEVRAGERFDEALKPGHAVEIMTGAPMPEGADAVVMVEHTRLEDGLVDVPAAEAGQNFNPRGAECRAGDTLLLPGMRLGFPEIALAASVGAGSLPVYQRPVVAIIGTGDELVEVGEPVLPHQIRNSNAYSLAVQVARAGGVPRVLPVAGDTVEQTAAIVEQALACDLVLLSGGVSAGKYDVVEPVLAGLGAEFFFDRVLIQPGQPLVFGSVRGRLFFGLPGNPASTMVCFEVFARAALELLGGAAESPLPIMRAPLTKPFRHRAGLTRFLPAWLDETGGLTPIPWAGSGDIRATARANCFLVADPDRPEYAAGELMGVLWR